MRIFVTNITAIMLFCMSLPGENKLVQSQDFTFKPQGYVLSKLTPEG